MKNAFTGEEMAKNPQSELDQARAAGLALKKLHDGELEEYGPPREDGTRATRQRSVGTVYDIPPTNGSFLACRVDPIGESVVDVNDIMKKYEKTGDLAELIGLSMASGKSGAMYGDFTSAPDFQEALNITIRGQEQFALLNANVRDRFQGDPVKFLAFASDPGNVDEMEALGLLKPEVVQARRDARLKAGSPPRDPGPTPPASQPPVGAVAGSTN